MSQPYLSGVPAPHSEKGDRDGGAPLRQALFFTPAGSQETHGWLESACSPQVGSQTPDSHSPAGLGLSGGWARRRSCCSCLSDGPRSRGGGPGLGQGERRWEQRASGSWGGRLLRAGPCRGVGGWLSLPGPLARPPVACVQQPAALPPPPAGTLMPTLRLGRAQTWLPVPSARVSQPPWGLCVRGELGLTRLSQQALQG